MVDILQIYPRSTSLSFVQEFDLVDAQKDRSALPGLNQ